MFLSHSLYGILILKLRQSAIKRGVHKHRTRLLHIGNIRIDMLIARSFIYLTLLHVSITRLLDNLHPATLYFAIAKSLTALYSLLEQRIVSDVACRIYTGRIYRFLYYC